MNVLFESLKVNHILLEEGVQEAQVDAVIIQNGKSINTTLVLSPTDLNRLLLKLNMLGVEVSLSENFNCYETANGNLYSLDMKAQGWSEVSIPEFIPTQSVRQIRA
jgi:hypothetical protein